jgi:hypothetical protein
VGLCATLAVMAVPGLDQGIVLVKPVHDQAGPARVVQRGLPGLEPGIQEARCGDEIGLTIRGLSGHHRGLDARVKPVHDGAGPAVKRRDNPRIKSGDGHDGGRSPPAPSRWKRSGSLVDIPEVGSHVTL